MRSLLKAQFKSLGARVRLISVTATLLDTSFLPFAVTNTWPRQRKKGRFILADSLRLHSITWQELEAAGHFTDKTELNAATQLHWLLSVFVLFICMSIHILCVGGVYVCVPQHICRSQWTVYGNKFSPFSLWTPGINLRPSG